MKQQTLENFKAEKTGHILVSKIDKDKEPMPFRNTNS